MSKNRKHLTPLPNLKRKPRSLVELFRDRRRWTKNKLANGNLTACCVRGGINFLCTGDPYKCKPENLAAIENKIIKAAGLPQTENAVVIWNNSPRLTHGEFLTVLRKARV